MCSTNPIYGFTNIQNRESEFIKLKDAPQYVASCFKPPFSNLNAVVDENEPKRKLIIVGHGLGSDITFLRNLGYDVYNLSNLQEFVDTSNMWQALKRDANPRNLGSVLAELDIVGWNLHNAGNDAVYTLQAMIGISVKQLYEREKRKEDRELEKKVRVEE
jgi:DNA polymerase III alpha subunit (gram-positive type)